MLLFCIKRITLPSAQQEEHSFPRGVTEQQDSMGKTEVPAAVSLRRAVPELPVPTENWSPLISGGEELGSIADTAWVALGHPGRRRLAGEPCQQHRASTPQGSRGCGIAAPVAPQQQPPLSTHSILASEGVI